jgi:DNA-binding transcriptional MerR regulator
MMQLELSLADLSSATGVEARTIRSWVAQGLLPAPLSRGALARYSSDTLLRIQAIRVMREGLGMSLADIRSELLSSPSERIAHLARRAEKLPRNTSVDAEVSKDSEGNALEYMKRLRLASHQAARSSSNVANRISQSPGSRGFDALEGQLSRERLAPARKARAEEWLRIPVTPDVELSVRGSFDSERQEKLLRCADLIRDILDGRDR